MLGKGLTVDFFGFELSIGGSKESSNMHGARNVDYLCGAVGGVMME